MMSAVIRRNLPHACTICTVAIVPALMTKSVWLVVGLLLVGLLTGILGVIFNPLTNAPRAARKDVTP